MAGRDYGSVDSYGGGDFGGYGSSDGYGSQMTIDCNSALGVIALIGFVELLRDIIERIVTQRTGRRRKRSIEDHPLFSSVLLSQIYSYSSSSSRFLRTFPGVLLPLLHGLVDVNDGLLNPECLECIMCEANAALVGRGEADEHRKGKNIIKERWKWEKKLREQRLQEKRKSMFSSISAGNKSEQGEKGREQRIKEVEEEEKEEEEVEEEGVDPESFSTSQYRGKNDLIARLLSDVLARAFTDHDEGRFLRAIWAAEAGRNGTDCKKAYWHCHDLSDLHKPQPNLLLTPDFISTLQEDDPRNPPS